jgi:signal peptidase I
MRSLFVAIVNWFAPGFSAGLASRPRAMAAWITAAGVSALACVVSIWFLPIAYAVRLAGAVDGARTARAARRAGVSRDWIRALIAVGSAVVIALALRVFALEPFQSPSSSMTPTLQVGDHFLVNKLSPRSVARGDVIVFRHPCEPAREYVARVVAVGGDAVEVRCDVVRVGGAPLASRLVAGQGCRYDDRDDVSGAWHDKPCSEYAETTGDRSYRVYYDPDRPARDGARATGPAQRDFPQLDGPRTPPSCAARDLGPPGVAMSNQQPGKLVETGAGGPCDAQLHYVVPADHVFTMGDNRYNANDSRFWGAVPLENVRGRMHGIYYSDGPSGFSVGRFGPVD